MNFHHHSPKFANSFGATTKYLPIPHSLATRLLSLIRANFQYYLFANQFLPYQM
nr:MAG TPA: hypothetical protein [Caudoviricetes sp.]